jgi:hypothetical protein
MLLSSAEISAQEMASCGMPLLPSQVVDAWEESPRVLWSGWAAAAARLGWEIAWVAVGDGKLGQDWRQHLTSQDVRNLFYNNFTLAMVQETGVKVLLLHDRSMSRL